MESILEIKTVNKAFGAQRVVRDVSLSVKRGEVFSLLGPSGCGKTTLLRMIAGFERPDSGSILLDGTDVAQLPPNRRQVNTVFQNYALFPHLSVADNIAFGLRAEGKPKIEIQEEVHRMLDLIRMHEHAHKKPSQISGGQKQRVAIARALIKKPKILLLDEPLAALDLKLRQHMLLELDRIHDEVGITFIYVTHDQDEAMSLSDHIAIMNEGVIEQLGTPAEVYELPKSRFVAEFIGDTNLFPGKVASVEGSDYCHLEVPGLGKILAYQDRPVAPGENVTLSLRPEKFNLSREKPTVPSIQNLLPGVVDTIIYMGSETRYVVRCGEFKLNVLRQHNRCLLEEKPITWEDSVWLTWHADDGNILQSTNGTPATTPNADSAP